MTVARSRFFGEKSEKPRRRRLAAQRDAVAVAALTLWQVNLGDWR